MGAIVTSRKLKPSASELRTMAQKLLEWSQELEMDSGVNPGCSGMHDRLLATAMKHYRFRRVRDSRFPKDVFGEPAWDILLDLFINARRKRPVSITSLCIASSAPATTALRYITLLEQRGLIRRTRAKHDRRVSYVELTGEAQQAMERHLADTVDWLDDSASGKGC